LYAGIDQREENQFQFNSLRKRRKGLETLWRELLAAEQEKAQSGQLRPYSIRFAHSGDKEFWDTYMSRLDELINKKEREAEVGGLLGWMELKEGN